MSDETTQFILGDAAADAVGQPSRRRWFGRKKKPEQPTTALTHCENCGAALAGAYCAQCGQHAIDYRRSLWRVLIDAADSFLNWDTKFLHSIGVLLAMPWRLTNDFNAGKRARYVHPLRLYLLASIAFFLIARLLNFNTNDAIHFDAKDRAEIETALTKLAAPESGLNEAERAKVEEARAKLALGDEKLTAQDRERMQFALGTLIASSMKQKFREKDHAKLNKALDRLNAPLPSPSPQPGENPPGVDPPVDPNFIGPTLQAPAPTSSPKPGRGFHFQAGTPPPGTAPFQINVGNDDKDKEQSKDPFERWIEGRIKDRIGEDGTKAKLFLDTLRNNIPTMMLCCIPLFAFVLKMLYFRQRRFYVEHLVYALHIHTFAYVGVVVIALGAMASERWSPILSGWLIGILCLLVVVQVFLSIRRVYRQGWFFTIFKFMFGGFVYLVILVLAIAATAFVTLLLPS